MVNGRSLLSNPLIAQAIQQQGQMGMPGGQPSPQPGQPPQGPPQPQQGPPPSMGAPMPPPDPKSEETKIILSALAGHLKFLDNVQMPPKPPQGAPGGQPGQMPPRPPMPPQMQPQAAQQALLANRGGM